MKIQIIYIPDGSYCKESDKKGEGTDSDTVRAAWMKELKTSRRFEKKGVIKENCRKTKEDKEEKFKKRRLVVK